MKNNFFERRGDTRPLPLVDDHIKNNRLWLLFIYSIVLIVGAIMASEKIPRIHAWIAFLILSLTPVCLFIIGYRLITGRPLRTCSTM